MQRRARSLERSAAAVAVALLCARSAAAANDDAEVARLRAAKQTVRSNVVPPGHTERYGHAEALVHAPEPMVRAYVLNYKRYKDLVPEKFQNVRIVAVDKKAGTTDVYMQVPVLHGVANFWALTRFTPIHSAGTDLETVEGRSAQGNVKTFHVVWSLRSVDPETTVLKLDLLLTPDFPVPQSVIDKELRDAAHDATDAMKMRIERENAE